MPHRPRGHREDRCCLGAAEAAMTFVRATTRGQAVAALGSTAAPPDPILRPDG
jgi:hypothetical protein